MFVLLMELYAMIQVSISLQTHRIVVMNFAPGNFILFGRNPWAVTRGTPVEKHWCNVMQLGTISR